MEAPNSISIPTERDRENARVRQDIAAMQEAAWLEVFKWALGTFGPGWEPSHRHYLVSKEEEEIARTTGARPKPAATVYTVRHADRRKRHFTVENGQVVECESYEAGFGELLLQPHPTRKIEVRGQLVAPHHFSLCFAPYELYHPKTAEELAKLRESRETKKAQREDKKWAEDYPLFAQAGIKRDD